MLPFGVTIPATVPQRSEIPDGLMSYSVYLHDVDWDNFKFSCDMRFAVVKVQSLKITAL